MLFQISYSISLDSNIGIQDYGTVKTLSLCPPTPNCIATSEEANDQDHYVPAWCDGNVF